MKGISTKVVTDEEKVRMHTKFAESENAYAMMAEPDIATWSKENGVLKVHTNTLHSWGIQVHCSIPKSLLKAGQKYGISVRVNHWEKMELNIQNVESSHRSYRIVGAHYDGVRVSAVCMLREADIVNGLGINTFLAESNTDYEFSDFRIWEIDELGGQ